jgi:hypothetical protein
MDKEIYIFILFSFFERINTKNELGYVDHVINENCI